MYNQGIAVKVASMRLGLNQNKMAEKLGVSRQMVSYWIKNKKPLSMDRAKQIADLLGVKLSEFFAMGE